MKSIGERWIESCCAPGNPLVISDTMGAELKAKTALTGSIILARRIRKASPEQQIATLLPSSAGTMLMNMAAMLLGKTLVSLNYTAGQEDILSAIAQAEVKTIYTSSRFLQRLEARGISTAYLDKAAKLVMLEDFRASTSLLERIRTLLYCKLTPAAAIKKRWLTQVEPETAAVILFSSGSEGDPKGVPLSHRNILTNVEQIMGVLELQEGDKLLANLPLFHSFGLTATEFMPLLERIPVVCHPDPTDALGGAEAIAKHKITLMFGTSSFYRLYIRNSKISPDMLASLRLVIAGAEKLQEEIREEFQHKFGKEILEGYGTTETSPVISVNQPNKLGPDGEVIRILNKPGSVGLPIPATDILITDPESFEELPIGEAGMILVSGGQVMQGYLKQPDKSAEVLREIKGKTWYVTGDKGYLDNDGFLYIQDRYSRFAKIGGEMVGLGVVEAAIQHALDDIELDLVAVNLPDARKGEIIVILANKDLDPSAVRKLLGSSGLPKLALPAAFYTVDEIPRLGSGKTDFGKAKQVAARMAEISHL